MIRDDNFDDINKIALVITEDPSVLIYGPVDDTIERTTMIEDVSFGAASILVDIDTVAEDMHAYTQHLLDEGYDPYIIEEGLFDWLGKLGSGMWQNVREQVAGWMLKLTGFKEGSFMFDYLKMTLGNIELRQLPKLFTDCEFFLNKITDGLSEYFIRNNIGKLFGDGFICKTIGQAISSAFNDDGFIETIQQSLAPKICNALKQGGRTLAQNGAKMVRGQDDQGDESGDGRLALGQA